jgi:CxxC-x17-CxxC domain-containing protein
MILRDSSNTFVSSIKFSGRNILRLEKENGGEPMSYEGLGHREREMHHVTCSDCGSDAQVPFKPTEGRAVYCNECFQKHKPQRRF